MLQLNRMFGAITVAAPTRRTLALPVSAQAIPLWLLRHKEAIWIATILCIAAVAHGVNMFHFPYYEDDEGTYMSQAWAVLREGQLAPYTYWYDHAPGGWLQIAVWSAVTGGFNAFGTSVESGRVFMLVLQVVSVFLLYCIARRISGRSSVATVAALLFIFSAYGGYFHRRVLLDNITTPWMLLSIFLLLSPRLTLGKVWLSAVALGISIMSKELTVFLVPAVAYLAFYRADRSQRAFAVIGWLGIVFSIISLYLLMAVLKGELFPTGSLLGGTNNHVSLLGTLSYQADRGDDGGPINPSSAFWQIVRTWMNEEPMLTVGGTACALLSVFLLGPRRVIGIMGLCTFSLWAFIGRGGEVIEFYLVPLLPLLALNIALILGLGFDLLARWEQPRFHIRRSLAVGIKWVAATACIAGIGAGYLSPNKGFAGDPLLLWTSTQADAQNQAMYWIEAHVPPKDSIITDNYLYTDLHDGNYDGHVYKRVDYYWKLDEDPAIGGKIYHNRWQNVDYLLSTIQLATDVKQGGLKLTGAVLKHSVVVARFDTGGWPIEIRQVVTPTRPAWHDSQPTATQFVFSKGENSRTEQATLTVINPNIYAASLNLTFRFADGAVNSQIVDVDASSQKQVAVSGLESHTGQFSLTVHADMPVSAALVVKRVDMTGAALSGKTGAKGATPSGF